MVEWVRGCGTHTFVNGAHERGSVTKLGELLVKWIIAVQSERTVSDSVHNSVFGCGVQVSMKQHIANSSQAAALVAAILTGNAKLLGAALGERDNFHLLFW